VNQEKSLKVWGARLLAIAVVGVLGPFAVGAMAQDDDQGSKVGATSDELKRIYLPLVVRVSSTLPFFDNFDGGLSSNWVVFENYPGPTKNDWYWQFIPSLTGIYFYDPDRGPEPVWRGYALSMYLGPGAQAWTDYQVVTTLRPFKDNIAGIWVRGTYEARTDMQGGQVGGYYVHIKPDGDRAYLWRIRPQTLHYHESDVVAQAAMPGGITNRWYNLKVAVQGANIKVWLKQDGQPDSAYVLLINWTDPDRTYMQGTVGFSAWRTIVYYNDIAVTPLSGSQ
jgi:hypothetical protein